MIYDSCCFDSIYRVSSGCDCGSVNVCVILVYVVESLANTSIYGSLQFSQIMVLD